MQLHSRKYSAHMRPPHRAGWCYNVTIQQERVSHASVGLSQPALCLRTSDISWKGSVRPEVSSAKELKSKKVSIYLNEIKKIFNFLPNTKIERISTFRCGSWSCSSLWWFAWAEPKSCPSLLDSMPPQVSAMSVGFLKSWIWNSSPTAIQVI